MLIDLRLALRSLARSPGYTAVVITILALGIGTTAALHSELEGSLLYRYNFPQIDRLVRLESVFAGSSNLSQTWLPRYLAYQSGARSFAAIAGGTTDTLNLLANGEPEGVRVARVTANYFTVLGVAPALGRTFFPSDGQPAADRVVVLSHPIWRDRFGADLAIIGRSIRLNQQVYQVVGVLGEKFREPPHTTYGAVLYIPYVPPVVATPENAYVGIATIARLKPGVTAEQAQTELRTILPEQGQPYAEQMGKYRAFVSAIDAERADAFTQRSRVMNWTATVAVAFLYLITCVNTGSLMLVRSLVRRRDVGIRLALGAGRWALVRPLFAEALVLSVAAIVLGVLVAKWFMPVLLVTGLGARDDAFHAMALSWTTLGGLAVLGLLTGLLVASGPAWSAARLNVADALKDVTAGGGESLRLRRLRGVLVIVEAALAVALLAGAGLMILTFQRLQDYDPGFQAVNRFMINGRISREDDMKPEVRLERYKQVVERLKAVPGVTAASLVVNFSPNSSTGSKVKLVGRPDAGDVDAIPTLSTPDFHELIGLPLRAGRPLAGLRPGDPASVVVSETFARNYFPGRSPLGERIQTNFGAVWEIIGVVGDIRSGRTAAQPRYYYPLWQRPSVTLFLVVVRTAAKPGIKFNADIRRAIYEVEPKISVTWINAYSEALFDEVWEERFVMTILKTLGLLALLLALMGLFAMMAYTVVQRRREFGIRMSFGATPGSIRWLVVRSGLQLVAFGVVIGLGLAWGLSRLMESMLYGSARVDWLAFGAAGLVMLLVALPACWWPAQRAGKLDVVKLLRSE